MRSSASPAPSRSRFWDILRGIGILSIVMGHCFQPAIAYVYTYHLAVFFFISGFLYNETKYSRDPFGHIAAKLKSSWPKYTLYMCTFTLLHNPFQHIGINPPGLLYGRTQTAALLGNALILLGGEAMGGALWFVPAWILSCGIFGGTIWFVFRFCPDKKAWAVPLRTALVSGISLLFCAAGARLMLGGFVLTYRMHLAFLVQPFFLAGWLIRRHLPAYRRWLKWYAALPCAVLLWWIIRRYSPLIDIAAGHIGNGWQYFLLAFLGIYCCMYLASLLESLNAPGSVFALYGKYSFDVMALHFFIFKLIDVFYGHFIANDPPEIYSAFPQAYAFRLWPVYIILGVTVPALIGAALARAGKQLAKITV